MSGIRKILLVGGTHGNELTGVRLIQQWPLFSPAFDYGSLQITPLIANPEAVNKRVRFIDQDLNRQFVNSSHTASADANSIESRRANELKTQYTGAAQQPDLIVDIHNTTSNMGATLILIERNNFTQALARYVAAKLENTNILLEDDKSSAEHPYLCTMGKQGVMLEMGAQAQGVCRADLFHQTLELLHCVMQFCHQWNQHTLPITPPCSVYRFLDTIHFPLTDTGNVKALVHPNLQDRDFQPLNPGDPVFDCFDGQQTTWSGSHTVYPHFINEAAYQADHVAFATAEKVEY